MAKKWVRFKNDILLMNSQIATGAIVTAGWSQVYGLLSISPIHTYPIGTCVLSIRWNPCEEDLSSVSFSPETLAPVVVVSSSP